MKNSLINVYPTKRATPYGRSGPLQATSVSATITEATDMVDPTTGLPMAKCVIPAANTSYQLITYNDVPTFEMGHNDTWILPIYLPKKLSNVRIQLLVSSASSMTGIEYRTLTFTSGNLIRGFNILHALHVEKKTGDTQYGELGTNSWYEWSNSGTITDDSPINAITVRLKSDGTQSEDTVIYVGSIQTAPQGWAMSSIMWMADDFPIVFHDHIIPVIESYGWRATFATTSSYSADPSTAYTPMNKVRYLDKIGHEIWGHAYAHDDMDTITTPEKIKVFRDTKNFWDGTGIPTAGAFMAWPFGAYDDESISLAKAAGYKLARGVGGWGFSPLAPAVNPFFLDGYSMERANSWHVDATLNGAILRGQGLITYAHNAVVGGNGIDLYPGAGKFYVDHFKRWAELVAKHEAAGRVLVTTPTEYFKRAGVDIKTDKFYEGI